MITIEDFYGTTAITECSKQIEQLLKERDEALEQLKVSDKIIEERAGLLKTIPACSSHGNQCVPHAIEWVETVREELKAAELRAEAYRKIAKGLSRYDQSEMDFFKLSDSEIDAEAARIMKEKGGE